MSGDEALARVAQDARADIRQLFDEQGNILLPHLWPDELANSVEAVDVKAGKVKLASKSTARRIILEQTGKLKTIGGILFDHAAYLQEAPPED